MKTKFKLILALMASSTVMTACATDHDHHDGFVLGAAMDANIAEHSIRPVDLPNSKGLTGQSGERAVAAIDRLNSGDQPELSEVSASGIGSSSTEQ